MSIKSIETKMVKKLGQFQWNLKTVLLLPVSEFIE